MDLTAKVQWLVDRAQISDLIHTFAACLDTKDWQGYASLFVDGGYIDIPEPTSKTLEYWRMYKEEMPVKMAPGLERYSATHHTSSNHLIKVEGDAASSRSYTLATHIQGDMTDFWTAGIWYDNTYERTPEGWKIATCKLVGKWMLGKPKQMKAN